MPERLQVASVLDQRRDDRRSSRQGGAGRPLSGRQRPAPDEQLRVHDLPRRPGLGDRLHLCLALARIRSSRPKNGPRSTTGRSSISGISRCIPKRFIESGCLKCHTQVTDIPQATKLQAGYQRIVKYGCTGCHTIGGEGSIGPDLSEERQVGPNLSHIAAKDAKDWVVKWIANPHAFRP